jgi:hypothetical protein
MIHTAQDIGRHRSPEPLAPREMMRPDQEALPRDNYDERLITIDALQAVAKLPRTALFVPHIVACLSSYSRIFWTG